VRTDFDSDHKTPTSPPLNVNVLWILVILMLLGTIAVVYVKTRPESVSAETELTEGIDDPVDPPKAPGSWDQRRMETLLSQAEDDYRQFLQAEKKEDRGLRRRYYNQARIRLQTFMDRVNENEEDKQADQEMIRRATELLSDLSKKARAED
jgi:hypothetical protein